MVLSSLILVSSAVETLFLSFVVIEVVFVLSCLMADEVTAESAGGAAQPVQHPAACCAGSAPGERPGQGLCTAR